MAVGCLIDYSKTFSLFIGCSDLVYLRQSGTAACMLKSWVQAPAHRLFRSPDQSFHLLRSFFFPHVCSALIITWDLRAPAEPCHCNSLNANDSY